MRLKKNGLIFMFLLVIAMMTSCSKNEQDVRMAFHGIDSGRNYDIGTHITAVTADFMTSDICAIPPEETQMEDDNLPGFTSILINITDNEMVFSKNIYEKIYPASTTKLMTALLILKYADLSDETIANATNGGITVPGAKLCEFKEGDKMTLETLLNCILVYSGNDACVIAAEYLCGTEEAFVELMNQEAVKLGAVDTHFVNSHGLHDEEHYTTAYDMYLMFMECMKYDEFIKIISKPNYAAAYKDKDGEPVSGSFETTNMFLLGTMDPPEDVKVYGGKTGSTGNAGDCLILLSERRDENGAETAYISGVFKATSKDSLYRQLNYLLDKK